jgi:hypothetical protein
MEINRPKESKREKNEGEGDDDVTCMAGCVRSVRFQERDIEMRRAGGTAWQ